MKTSYTLEIEKILPEGSVVERFCLDQPTDGSPGTSSLFRRQGLRFRGWLLLADSAQASLKGEPVVYLREGNQPLEEAQAIALDEKRSDVIKHFYADSHAGKAAKHPQVNCGFDVSLVFNHDTLELGALVDGDWVPAYRIRVRGSLTVLQGAGRWLFLDNDTNNSVAQHTGEARLDRAQKRAWAHYMQGVQQVSNRQGLRYCLLVAPAKEAVYADKHPLPRAETTIMDDMQAMAPNDFPLLYPVDALRAMSSRSFRVTDTHWTSPGAAQASVLVTQKLGFSAEEARALFSKDKYKLKRQHGDLGIKLFPPKAHREKLLTGYRYKRQVIYDNGLPNFGRVLVTHNPDALNPQRCLILGSSSAYSMLAYLSRVFSELILVHCAGNLDESLIEAVSPDCLLLQTNARFVVRAPVCDYSLQQDIEAKLARLTEAERRKLAKAAHDMAGAADSALVDSLHAIFKRAQI